MAIDLFSQNIEQLKTIYAKTDDEVKKFLIKQVIRVKLEQAKKNKLDNVNKKQRIKSKQMDNLLDDLVDETDETEPSGLWSRFGKIDNKYVEEIKFDHANNKLMDRMNNELDFRIKGTQKKFSSPFADDNMIGQQFMESDHYESYKNFKKNNVVDSFTGYKMK